MDNGDGAATLVYGDISRIIRIMHAVGISSYNMGNCQKWRGWICQQPRPASWRDALYMMISLRCLVEHGLSWSFQRQYIASEHLQYRSI